MKSTIKPFKATHYNPAVIKKMSLVTCPPYDVIDSKEQAFLRKLSKFNFINIILTTNGDYGKCGGTFRSWIEKKVLVDDDADSLYLYEQTFSCGKKKFRRFGILSLLRMDMKGAVSPHEYTLKKPREDRARMIREVKANLSPVFVIIPRVIKTFNDIYRIYSARKPLFGFTDTKGCKNRVWRISDGKHVEWILKAVETQKLVIADGHHRFEVAHNYFMENKDRFQDINYVLAYIATAQEGLLILPTHRVVTLEEDTKTALDKLGRCFHVMEVKRRELEDKLKKSKKGFAFGICADKSFYFLRLKKTVMLDKIIRDPYYRKLDTYLLHNFVFPLITVKGEIAYTHDIREAEQMAGKYKTGFILKPVSLDVVFEMANKGYRFPQKSTYFYPKLLSGIVVRRFVEAW